MSRLYKGFARNRMGYNFPFDDVVTKSHDDKSYGFSKESMDVLINVMSDLKRPREEKFWQRFDRENKIAWKTGTSYGHKDAWAIGFNSKYLVGIWVGNQNGEGRYNLTGITKAAPVMFDIFNILPENSWFDVFQYKGNDVFICKDSGCLAGKLCNHVEKKKYPFISHKLTPCSYHKKIAVTKNGYRITENCNENIDHYDTLFLLPPNMEYFYMKEHSDYQGLYAFPSTCDSISSTIQIIYPENDMKIFLPRESKGQKNNLICKAYSLNSNAKIFWFLDDDFIQETKGNSHEIMIDPIKGNHELKVVDNSGNYNSVFFSIIDDK
ncbi:MAG: hypothetical protein R2771_04230 [Saprospiraceae bacterium]